LLALALAIARDLIRALGGAGRQPASGRNIYGYNLVAASAFYGQIIGAIIRWGERKRLANLFRRGLDFADLTMDIFERSLVFHAKQDRFVAPGSWALRRQNRRRRHAAALS
jgi:hypothetical protein